MRLLQGAAIAQISKELLYQGREFSM